jgi:hypothetical protein
MNLEFLHDSTLREVKYLNSDKTVEIEIRSSDEAVRLQAVDVTELCATALEPWGRSASINSAHFALGKLTIEMQSGDDITVKCGQVRLHRQPR